ncbi:GspE/PulE family protein [Thermodesulfobacteriota bacterium]
MQLIGKILTENFGLSSEALSDGLNTQDEKGGRIGEILIRQKAVSETELLKALGIQFGLKFISNIPTNELKTEFTEIVPIQFLKKYRMVPIVASDNVLIIINDPLLFQPLDDLRLLLGLNVTDVTLAPHSAILSAINFAYDMSRDSAEQVIQDMHDEDSNLIISEIEGAGDLLDDTSDAPIIKLVNLMLSQAIKDRASDIHIEPTQSHLKIRYRVDGILYDMLSPPKHIQSSLISRIKVMAEMNIAEKRLPQDGRIEIRIGDKSIDIRVSTIPIAFGERVVLRLLDKTRILLRVADLGMPP